MKIFHKVSEDSERLKQVLNLKVITEITIV